ncbi:hypothetical protein H696_04736 [Fonticula alba]|uniref:Uncharacterized protein n=1 Tax=Fonticula alba TaxID=691883 RepID=A0A058Z4L0_FONAL|nr:hypothetical protein H696_04736 [Fonticula alba]KCV68442.1 hypothetical protein H696_04736 [Fonticula alba]|eukprot:XP_009496874.1 hypothetical protein H696_04736 [Fonticula alba]
MPASSQPVQRGLSRSRSGSSLPTRGKLYINTAAGGTPGPAGATPFNDDHPAIVQSWRSENTGPFSPIRSRPSSRAGGGGGGGHSSRPSSRPGSRPGSRPASPTSGVPHSPTAGPGGPHSPRMGAFDGAGGIPSSPYPQTLDWIKSLTPAQQTQLSNLQRHFCVLYSDDINYRVSNEYDKLFKRERTDSFMTPNLNSDRAPPTVRQLPNRNVLSFFRGLKPQDYAGFFILHVLYLVREHFYIDSSEWMVPAASTTASGDAAGTGAAMNRFLPEIEQRLTDHGLDARTLDNALLEHNVLRTSALSGRFIDLFTKRIERICPDSGVRELLEPHKNTPVNEVKRLALEWAQSLPTRAEAESLMLAATPILPATDESEQPEQPEQPAPQAQQQEQEQEEAGLPEDAGQAAPAAAPTPDKLALIREAVDMDFVETCDDTTLCSYLWHISKSQFGRKAASASIALRALRLVRACPQLIDILDVVADLHPNPEKRGFLFGLTDREPSRHPLKPFTSSTTALGQYPDNDALPDIGLLIPVFMPMLRQVISAQSGPMTPSASFDQLPRSWSIDGGMLLSMSRSPSTDFLLAASGAAGGSPPPGLVLNHQPRGTFSRSASGISLSSVLSPVGGQADGGTATPSSSNCDTTAAVNRISRQLSSIDIAANQ